MSGWHKSHATATETTTRLSPEIRSTAELGGKGSRDSYKTLAER